MLRSRQFVAFGPSPGDLKAVGGWKSMGPDGLGAPGPTMRPGKSRDENGGARSAATATK